MTQNSPEDQEFRTPEVVDMSCSSPSGLPVTRGASLQRSRKPRKGGSWGQSGLSPILASSPERQHPPDAKLDSCVQPEASFSEAQERSSEARAMESGPAGTLLCCEAEMDALASPGAQPAESEPSPLSVASAPPTGPSRSLRSRSLKKAQHNSEHAHSSSPAQAGGDQSHSSTASPSQFQRQHAFLQFFPPPSPVHSGAPLPALVPSPLGAPLGSHAMVPNPAATPGPKEAGAGASPAAVILPQGLAWGSQGPGGFSGFTPEGGQPSLVPLPPASLLGKAGSSPGSPYFMVDGRVVLPPGSPAAAMAAAAMAGRGGFSLVLPFAQNRRAAGKGKGPGTGRRACGCPARMCKCGACPPKPANARRQKGKGPGTGRRACGCPSRRCSCGAAALLSLPQIPVLVPVVVDMQQGQQQQCSGAGQGVPLFPQGGQLLPIHQQFLQPQQQQHFVAPGVGDIPVPGHPYLVRQHSSGLRSFSSTPGKHQDPGASQWQEDFQEPQPDPRTAPTPRELSSERESSAGDEQLCTVLRLGHEPSPTPPPMPGCARPVQMLWPPTPEDGPAQSPTVTCTSKLTEDDEPPECEEPQEMQTGEDGEADEYGRGGANGMGFGDAGVVGNGRLPIEDGGELWGGLSAHQRVSAFRSLKGEGGGGRRVRPRSEGSTDKEGPERMREGRGKRLMFGEQPEGSEGGVGFHSLSDSEARNSSSSCSSAERDIVGEEGGSRSWHREARAPCSEPARFKSQVWCELRSFARALASLKGELGSAGNGNTVGNGGSTAERQQQRMSPAAYAATESAKQHGGRVKGLLQKLHDMCCIRSDCGALELQGAEAVRHRFNQCKLPGGRLVSCSGVCGRAFHPGCLTPGEGSSLRSSPTNTRSSDAGQSQGDPRSGSESGKVRWLCPACRAWADAFRAVAGLLSGGAGWRGPSLSLTSSSSSSNMLRPPKNSGHQKSPALGAQLDWSWEDIIPGCAAQMWAAWSKAGISAPVECGCGARGLGEEGSLLRGSPEARGEEGGAGEEGEGRSEEAQGRTTSPDTRGMVLGVCTCSQAGTCGACEGENDRLYEVLQVGVKRMCSDLDMQRWGEQERFVPLRHWEQGGERENVADAAGSSWESASAVPLTPPLESLRHKKLPSSMTLLELSAAGEGGADCAKAGSAASTPQGPVKSPALHGAGHGAGFAPWVHKGTALHPLFSVACAEDLVEPVPPEVKGLGRSGPATRGGVSSLLAGELPLLRGGPEEKENTAYTGMVCLSPSSVTPVPASPGGARGPSQAVVLLTLGGAENLTRGPPSATHGPSRGVRRAPVQLLCCQPGSPGNARDARQHQSVAVMPLKLPEHAAGGSPMRGIEQSSGGLNTVSGGSLGYLYCYYMQNDGGVLSSSAPATSAGDSLACSLSPRKRRRKQPQPRSSADLEAAC